MPNNEARRPADWYRCGPEGAAEAGSWRSDSSDVVIPRPAEADCSTHQPPPRSAGFEGPDGKKRRRTKIISLSVCVFVLIAAAALAGWQFGRRGQAQTAEAPERNGGPSIAIPGASGEDGQVYDDFREYFENYYSGSDSVDIAAGPTGTGVTLTLEPAAGPELSLQEIYEKVSPAVVGITAYKDGEKYSWGTGVVFTSDGYVITNTHILEGGDGVKVAFSDGTEYDALLVGADSASDIAVLYMEGEDFPCAAFGSSDALRVGDAAIAIGNPLGEAYSGTMTNGIISAINRNVTYNGHSMTLLQTNAALNEGNSGGPLVNAYGQVVGITNMKIMSTYYATVEGIGFAIPSTVVKEIADQLIENGIVLGEPTIGIVAGSVSAEAMMLYDLPMGVYVSQVNDGSDAKEKGLLVGDIILEVNGTAVSSVAEVNAIKEGLSVGDILTLTVYRDGETFDMDVALVDRSVIQ